MLLKPGTDTPSDARPERQHFRPGHQGAAQPDHAATCHPGQSFDPSRLAAAPTTVEALTAVAEACRVHARWRADLGTVVGR